MSIRNMRGILESLVQAGSFEKDVDNLVEYARMSLGRQICHRVAPDDELRVVGLDPALEETLTQSLKKVRDTQQMVLDPGFRQQLVGALERAIDGGSAGAVVVPVPLRRHVRNLLAPTRFGVPVLSYAEIVGSLQLTFIERLSDADVREVTDAVPAGIEETTKLPKEAAA